MASRPPNEPPQTILVGQFSGIKNTVNPERLGIDELETAVNVDLDDAGQASRRRGQTRVATGNFHSLRNHRDQLLGVKEEYLGTISPTYLFTNLAHVGPDRLKYVAVGDDLYYVSRSASGRLDADWAVHPWGVHGGGGTWLSPVITPTETLGPVAGKLLGPPPLAEHAAWYKGRIYLGAGKVLWATELYLYDHVDRTRNYIYFEDEITMVASLDDGIYVGTEGGAYFLSGTFSDGLARKHITDAAVIPGTEAVVPSEKVHPMGRRDATRADSSIVFMTTDGVFAGFGGGEAYNLTLGKVVFPMAQSGAALFRDQSGVNSYVAVTDSAGSPSANARIGDYADAEIRRFQGG